MSASYYLTATFDNCVPRRQLGSCSIDKGILIIIYGCSVTRPFLSPAKGVACETRIRPDHRRKVHKGIRYHISEFHEESRSVHGDIRE